jgi:hypothetical protein
MIILEWHWQPVFLCAEMEEEFMLQQMDCV